VQHTEGQAEDFNNEDCLMCHANQELLPDGSAELFIKPEILNGTVQVDLSCTDCHSGISELPHLENVTTVGCSSCHEDVANLYAESLHGQAAKNSDLLAPQCYDCHGTHDILPRKDVNSRTNPINILNVCGSCHADNAPVAQQRVIS
jgi:nitrate/TMAO reductase-like tetraheme cytochrome c subunit